MAILRVCAALLLVATVRGQSLVDTGDVAAVRKAFEKAGALQPLRCQIHPVQPAPNYRLRLQTGYRIEVPLGQFRGSKHELQVLLRITPEGREPVYLENNARLPDVPETKLQGEFTGSFLVGEGNYSVGLLLKDESGRGCQNKWQIQAKRNGSLHELKDAIPAGAVLEAGSPDPPSDGPEHTGAMIGHLTVLVHAAPMAPGRTALNSEDIDRLTGSLATLLAQMPATAVRVAIFNTEQRQIVWQKDDIVTSDLEDASDSLRKLQLGTVDYQAMKGWKSPADWIGGVLEHELGASPAADAILVLGPAARIHDPVPAQWNTRLDAPAQLYYLQYQDRQGSSISPTPSGGPDSHGWTGRGPMGPGAAGSETIRTAQAEADTIDAFIHRWRGETLAVRSPQDFADAVRHLNSRIPRNSVPGLRISSPAPHPVMQPSGDVSANTVATARPSGGTADPTEVLVRLRDRVLAHARLVPNYTCVEKVERERYTPVAGPATKSCDTILAERKSTGKSLELESKDRLRLDVAFADGGEIYSWAGASSFEDKELDEWLPAGAIGTGPFAASLLSIFEPRTAEFSFEGEKNVDGRRLLQYAFAVPQERSHYRVKANHDWVISGYTGTLLVDPETAELGRVTVRSEELPAATTMCETDTVLNYSLVKLGANEYFLPVTSQQRFIGRDGEESENVVTFSACREYRGQSSVTFGSNGADRTANNADGPGPAFQPDLPVTVELTAPIDADQAAAGDVIQGRLVTTVGPAEKGARVEGRLMRVETHVKDRNEISIVYRWERVEINGAMREWSLTPNRQTRADSRPRGILQRRGTVIELPNQGEERYGLTHVPAEHPVVEAGMRSEWTTSR